MSDDLVRELGRALQKVVDSGVLNLPTDRAAKTREWVFSALWSYRDYLSVTPRPAGTATSQATPALATPQAPADATRDDARLTEIEP